jgi:two-component system sensor histidine kinase KdpD
VELLADGQGVVTGKGVSCFETMFRTYGMRFPLKSSLGLAACSVAASLLIIVLQDGRDVRLAAPAVCLQVVILTALFFGRWPALIGSVLASLTFALFLFPPLGSLAIDDPRERAALTLFQLFSVFVAYLSPSTPPRALPGQNGPET